MSHSFSRDGSSAVGVPTSVGGRVARPDTARAVSEQVTGDAGDVQEHQRGQVLVAPGGRGELADGHLDHGVLRMLSVQGEQWVLAHVGARTACEVDAPEVKGSRGSGPTRRCDPQRIRPQSARQRGVPRSRVSALPRPD